MKQEEVQLNVSISPETDDSLRTYVFQNKTKKKLVVEEAVKFWVKNKKWEEKQ